MRDEKDDIFSSLKWLIIISIILSVIFLGFYWYNVSLPVNNHISDKNDDWSAFASIVGACGSLIAAFGTIGVIAVSIKQFRTQQEQIDKQDVRWESDQKIINFRRFQEHKNEFEKHLNNVEKQSKRNVRCENKINLYKSIFPNNNFDHCSYKISHKDITELKIVSAFNNTVSMLDSVDSTNIDGLIQHFDRFFKFHSFSIESNDDSGEFIFEGDKLNFGPLSIYYKIHALKYYLTKTIEFGGYDTSDKIFNKPSLSLNLKILELFLFNPNEVHSNIKIKENNFACIKDVLKVVYFIEKYSIPYKRDRYSSYENTYYFITHGITHLNDANSLMSLYDSVKDAIAFEKLPKISKDEKTILFNSLEKIKRNVKDISGLEFDK